MFARLDRYGYAPLWALGMLLVVALLAIAPDTAIAQETAPAEDPHAQDRGAGGAAEQVVVAPGDSLWSISEEHLGAGATARQVALEVGRIYALNRDRVEDPNTIFAGQKLLVQEPGAAERRAPRPSQDAEAAPGDEGTRSGAPNDGRQAGRGAEGGAAVPHPAAEPVDLPEQEDVGPVPSVGTLRAGGPTLFGNARSAVGAASSLMGSLFANDDPYADRRALGWAMMLGSVATALVALALTAARVARRSARRSRLSERRLEEWHLRAYGGGAVSWMPSAVPVRSPDTAVRALSPSRGAARTRKKAGVYDAIGHNPNGHNVGAKPLAKSKRARLRRARRPGAKGVPLTPAAAPRSRRTRRAARPRPQNRRKTMAVHDKGRNARRGWEVSAPLRRGLEDLPLRAEGERLADLRPLVEAELATVELIECRRRLTGKERRQASALRALLGSIRENEGAAAARLAERR